MKIAISGAHRVGKTTLAEALLERLPGYTLKMEPYYELEEAGYVFPDIPGAADFIQQFDHSVQQLSQGVGDILFDRCPVDILAYIHAVDRKRNIQSRFQTAQTIMEGIDLLVFVPVEKPDLIPGGQDGLSALRRDVNDILDEWIWDFNIETIAVKGDLADRCRQVLSKLA